MRRRVIGVCLWLGLVFIGTAAESAEKTEADLPPAARRVLAAMNSGRRDLMAKTIDENFHPRALERRSKAQVLEAMAEAAVAGGGLVVKQVWRAEALAGVAVLATRRAVEDFRGRSTVRWLYFETILAPAGDPGAGRIEDFTLQAIPNPDAGADPALVFPSGVLSSEGAVVAEIRSRIELLADEDRFSGTILVAKGDRVLFQDAYGEAEKNHRVPNEMNSVFHMASATKMFTSVAIAQLVEAKKLGFDETLLEAWPDYPNPDVARKITLARILSHTSGLGEGLIPEVQKAETAVRTLQDAIVLSAGRPLLFEPGTGWSYSNLGFMILGRVIELASGLSYESYVEKHILQPAGMTRTGNYDITTVVPGLAVGYGRQADDPLGIRERHSNWPLVLGFRGTSAGGYYSTASDMFLFLRALRSYKLLGRDTTDFITSGKHKFASGRQYAFGFWDIPMNGRSVRGHGGGGAGYGINTEANTLWTPGGEKSDYAVVILSNYDPPTTQEFSKAVWQFLARQK